MTSRDTQLLFFCITLSKDFHRPIICIMGGSMSTAQINTLKNSLGTTYAKATDIASLKSELALFLRQADALQNYMSKADYQSQSVAFAKLDQLKDFVTATNLDAKLAGYLKGDALKDADIEKMVVSLTGNQVFLNSLSGLMARSSTALAQSLAPLIARDANFNANMTTNLKADPAFLSSVADKLTTDPVYKVRITGPPGAVSDPASLNASMESRSMWCAATGDICSLPAGKTANFPGNVNIAGTLTPHAINYVNGKAIQFGSDVPVGSADGQRDTAAGQVGYNIHGGTNARPHLGIVGGGKHGQPRRVRLWEEVNAVGSVSVGTDGADGKFYLNPGSDAWLRLQNKAGVYGGTGLAADKLYAEQSLHVPGQLQHSNGWMVNANDNHWVVNKDGVFKGAIGKDYTHFPTKVIIDNDLEMKNYQALHFGSDVPPGTNLNSKQADAGKIGYNLFNSDPHGRPHLAIVGAGRSPRRVRIWDDVEIMGRLWVGGKEQVM